MMKKAILAVIGVLVATTTAHATQETFTTAGALDCSAVSYCVQNTSDNLFTVSFVPTYPTSAPSPTGFNVNQQSVEISNANGGPLDLNIMQVVLTGSEFYTGVSFVGAIQLEAQDAGGTWWYVSQWSTYIGSKGVYVMFNGRNALSPLVRNVKAIRLSGINGGTAFRIGMLNLTAH